MPPFQGNCSRSYYPLGENTFPHLLINPSTNHYFYLCPPVFSIHNEQEQKQQEIIWPFAWNPYSSFPLTPNNPWISQLRYTLQPDDFIRPQILFQWNTWHFSILYKLTLGYKCLTMDISTNKRAPLILVNSNVHAINNFDNLSIICELTYHASHIHTHHPHILQPVKVLAVILIGYNNHNWNPFTIGNTTLYIYPQSPIVKPDSESVYLLSVGLVGLLDKHPIWDTVTGFTEINVNHVYHPALIDALC